MRYSIDRSADGRCVILTVHGSIDRERAMALHREAHALGARHGLRRYLVDVTDARNTDSLVDQYAFAYDDMRGAAGIDPGARVATLVSPGDRSHDFVETVAQNAGLHMRLFTSGEAAPGWLFDAGPAAGKDEAD